MSQLRPQPTLETDRLILRPLRAGDAPIVQRLAGDRDVASTTLSLPHPYEDGMAEAWIESTGPAFESGTAATFAVVLRSEDQLIGAVGLRFTASSRRAELGYWIGKPYWRKGFATEAAAAVVGYGFEQLQLRRIYAHHMARNPASGGVLEKLGMRKEGTLRHHFMKGDELEDVVIYGLLREEWTPPLRGSHPGQS